MARHVEHEPRAAPVWPARLVPAPRVITGTPKRPATAIAAATSSASHGKATTSGSRAYMLASLANSWREYGVVADVAAQLARAARRASSPGAVAGPGLDSSRTGSPASCP